MTKIYLALRYSRRLELCGYADNLRELGFGIISRWLEGSHQVYLGKPLGKEYEEAIERGESAVVEMRKHFALEDLQDLGDADWMISFTEPSRTLSNSRGGRHVEFGYALASLKRCFVIGHLENIFHCLPFVEYYDGWDSFLNCLKSEITLRRSGE